MSHANEILDLIKSHAGPEAVSRAHAGYTGSQRVSYGLSTPDRRRIVKAWIKAHRAALTYDAWLVTIDDLYHGTSLDEWSAGSALLDAFPRYRRELPLNRLASWLEGAHGWAEIDSVCQSVFTGQDVLTDWPTWEAFLRQLVADEHISKRRASIVLLIKPLRDSDDPRLLALALENVAVLPAERHKLITKAVSWVLRAAIKHHRAAVERYLDANREALPAVAVREVSNKLRTGKK